MTLSEIRKILEERNLRPLKQLGQNFLFDQNTCRLIVDALGAPPGSSVVEIGPGLGALTGLLLENTYPVTALEFDRGLALFLRERFAGNNAFHLVEGDALETLAAVRDQSWVIGNLPYNISTPLLMTLVRLKPAEQTCVFTLQKEIGLRLIAAPRSKDYGAVTVFLQTFYKIEIVRILSNKIFYPEPQVHSAVLKFTSLDPGFSPEQRDLFHQFVRRGFSQRRKKLKSLLPVSSDARAEELSVSDWKDLFMQTPDFIPPSHGR